MSTKKDFIADMNPIIHILSNAVSVVLYNTALTTYGAMMFVDEQTQQARVIEFNFHLFLQLMLCSYKILAQDMHI